MNSTFGTIFCRHISTYGFPTAGQVIQRNPIAFAYNTHLKSPVWIQEKILPDCYKKGRGQTLRRIIADPLFKHHQQPSNKDFEQTNLSRGHLAAVGNYSYARNLQVQVNMYTNIVPQDPNMNSGAWHELEQKVRVLAKTARSVHVVTGTLFLGEPQWIGKNVAVPTHLYKVILITDTQLKHELECYLMPNQPIDEPFHIDRFKTSEEEISALSGIQFFPNRPDSAG